MKEEESAADRRGREEKEAVAKREKEDLRVIADLVRTALEISAGGDVTKQFPMADRKAILDFWRGLVDLLLKRGKEDILFFLLDTFGQKGGALDSRMVAGTQRWSRDTRPGEREKLWKLRPRFPADAIAEARRKAGDDSMPTMEALQRLHPMSLLPQVDLDDETHTYHILGEMGEEEEGEEAAAVRAADREKAGAAAFEAPLEAPMSSLPLSSILIPPRRMIKESVSGVLGRFAPKPDFSWASVPHLELFAIKRDTGTFVHGVVEFVLNWAALRREHALAGARKDYRFREWSPSGELVRDDIGKAIRTIVNSLGLKILTRLADLTHAATLDLAMLAHDLYARCGGKEGGGEYWKKTTIKLCLNAFEILRELQLGFNLHTIRTELSVVSREQSVAGQIDVLLSHSPGFYINLADEGMDDIIGRRRGLTPSPSLGELVVLDLKTGAPLSARYKRDPKAPYLPRERSFRELDAKSVGGIARDVDGELDKKKNVTNLTKYATQVGFYLRLLQEGYGGVMPSRFRTGIIAHLGSFDPNPEKPLYGEEKHILPDSPILLQNSASIPEAARKEMRRLQDRHHTYFIAAHAANKRARKTALEIFLEETFGEACYDIDECILALGELQPLMGM